MPLVVHGEPPYIDAGPEHPRLMAGCTSIAVVSNADNTDFWARVGSAQTAAQTEVATLPDHISDNRGGGSGFPPLLSHHRPCGPRIRRFPR